jgi:hypothetical protein
MRRLAPIILLLASSCRRAALAPLGLADSEISRVTVARGTETFLLSRSPAGAWRIAPLGGEADAADAAAAAALLDGLRGLRTDYDLPGDGKAAGLAPAEAVHVAVFAAGHGDASFEASFGRRTLGRAVHASAPGGPVLVVEGPSPALLARGAAQWRETLLLGPSCARVETDAGSGFRLASPATAASLCAARARAMTPGDVPEELTGLKRPALRVRAGAAALSVGARSGAERWLRVDGRPGLFRADAAPFEAAAAEAAR